MAKNLNIKPNVTDDKAVSWSTTSINFQYQME